jgi:hypothetical protein
VRRNNIGKPQVHSAKFREAAVQSMGVPSEKVFRRRQNMRRIEIAKLRREND